MFRQTKRKPKHRGVLRRNDDDDGEGGEPDVQMTPPARSKSLLRQEKEKEGDDGKEGDEEESRFVIRRHKDHKSFVSQKKRKESSRSLHRGARSSLQDNQEEDGSSRSKKRKREKHRSKGLGFGAMTMMIDEDGDDMGMPAVPNSDSVAPGYGKEALEALKSAQAAEKPKELQETSKESTSKLENKVEDDNGSAPSTANKAENFIPLHEIPEAMDEDAPIVDDETSKPIILEDPDDDNWEEQVARRAGIKAAVTSSSKATTRPAVSAPRLDMLRQNLQETVQHLSKREEDLGHAIMRREADLAQAQADRKRQKHSIEEAGKACLDYQKLRYELAMWVGALRDLDEKVDLILKSIFEMVYLHFEMAHQEWVHWQEDVCVTLREFQRLDRVLGRQPPDSSAEESQTQLDEFGRDIGSQIRRDRENRCRRRKERIDGALQLCDPDGTDDILAYLWTKEELTGRRYDILQEALRVAVDDLDDAYASPRKLGETFSSWKKEYADEFCQCYADLSLADLAHVFDQVDLCRSKWIRGLLKSSEEITSDDALFPTAIQIAQDEGDPDTSSASSAMERAFQKRFLPFLLELLREYPSVLFLSNQLSRLFCGSIADVISKIGKDSQSSKDICGAISSAGTVVLESLSISILRSPERNFTDDLSGSSKERLDDALWFASAQQAKWIQRLVLNLLELWLPVLEQSEIESQNLGRSILGFLSENYLYLLSSLPASQDAPAHLGPIWKSLSQSYEDLLESPEFIFQSAPLRAAACAYGLPSLR